MVMAVAATVATAGRLRLSNCPRIIESEVLPELIRESGGDAVLECGELRLETAGMRSGRLDATLSGQAHGSAYLLPGLVGRLGVASLKADGGCALGSGNGRRPISHFVAVLERFGAKVTPDSNGWLHVEGDGLRACELDLLDFTTNASTRAGSHYSGATKTAILSAAVADGETRLRNLYPKREVHDLLLTLARFGVDIEYSPDLAWASISGRSAKAGSQASLRLVPDLIEVFTWAVVGALASPAGITVEDPDLEGALVGLQAELHLLERAGVTVEISPQVLSVAAPGRLRPIDVRVLPAGIFSDSMPLVAALMSHCDQASVLTDQVWGARFGYAEGLAALGARVERCGPQISVSRDADRSSRDPTVYAPDLRAAAALVVAALANGGTTSVVGAEHLRRGYHDLPGALADLGAQVVRRPH
jgi:UDP-N-acetylglucosamine 1-carboxyvinyltransferase